MSRPHKQIKLSGESEILQKGLCERDSESRTERQRARDCLLFSCLERKGFSEFSWGRNRQLLSLNQPLTPNLRARLWVLFFLFLWSEAWKYTRNNHSDKHRIPSTDYPIRDEKSSIVNAAVPNLCLLIYSIQNLKYVSVMDKTMS